MKYHFKVVNRMKNQFAMVQNSLCGFSSWFSYSVADRRKLLGRRAELVLRAMPESESEVARSLYSFEDSVGV